MFSLLGIFIFALVVVWLHNRISRIEELLRAKGTVSEMGEKSQAPLLSPVPQEALSSSTLPQQTQTPISGNEELAVIDKFFVWAKEDWLLKLGAILLLIGFGWLATYAFANNWIGPMGRIALGLIAGVLILLLGWWRIKTYVYQGSTFLVLGSSVILLTTFAAREIYGFFTPLVAIGLMFMSAVFVAFVSIIHRHLPLALASLIFAGIAPLLTGSSGADFISLFSYLFVVTVGTVWVVALTGWRILGAAALAMVALYSLPYLLIGRSLGAEVVLAFTFAFTAVFFITSILGILKLAKERIVPDLITAGGTGLFLLVWIVMAAPEEWKSSLMVAWILVFAFGGFLVFRLTQRSEPFYVYLGVSMAMLAAATAVELQGSALVIAYSIESGIIALVAYAILRDLRISQILSWLLLGPAYLSMGSVISRSWHTGVIHKDFFVLLVLAAVFSGLGFFFSWAQKQKINTGEKEFAYFTAGLLIIGSAYIHVLLWLSLHATTLSDDVATMIALVVYTLIGLSAYFYGKSQEKRIMRLYGAVLLVLVVGRLLLIDVWDMALAGRIITFFLVGILLTTTAFVGRGKKVLPMLVLAMVGSTTLYASSANALSTASQETIHAYRQLKELSPVSILVPTVVEIPFETEELERFGFAVLDEVVDSFQPVFFTQETSVNEIDAAISATNQSAQNAARMVDGNPQTYTAFALPEEAQGTARLLVQGTGPITSSSLTVLLDNHVALPTSIEIRAQVSGTNAIVLAKTPMRQAAIRFPRTTSQQWTITLTYAQPLRISELKLMQENATRASSHALRFLVQPGRTYQIYFNPDRHVSPVVGEAGNLADDQGVLRLPSPPAQFNRYYKQADIDGDGVPDILDNCVSVSNADQLDVDRNGRGDACDDFDRDGLINSQDNCPNDPNRGQADIDADGIGDACDAQESRFTERYKWIPWLGIAFAALTLIVLFALTAKSMAHKSDNDQPPVV